jgi:hypothetical protein
MRQHLHKDVQLLAKILVLGTATARAIAESLSQVRGQLTDGDEVANAAKCHIKWHCAFCRSFIISIIGRSAMSDFKSRLKVFQSVNPVLRPERGGVNQTQDPAAARFTNLCVPSARDDGGAGSRDTANYHKKFVQ